MFRLKCGDGEVIFRLALNGYFCESMAKFSLPILYFMIGSLCIIILRDAVEQVLPVRSRTWIIFKLHDITKKVNTG
jgi:hypothetical protein